ncbi:hypothetical protein ACJIZ3_008906 [Penstemon smallii]|uniref:Myb/SANT-like domain-containing protein n=1 Tax=Penstemon smallii TaxID=265156 RepID=A0ABD3TB35_9LAMI
MEESQPSRRVWSKSEEDQLIIALKELVTNGWRSDNAFRSGYTTNLAATLAVRCPGSNLTPTNIASKLTVWKRKYGILSGILGTSGIGWCETEKKILLDGTDVWDTYVKGKGPALEPPYPTTPDCVNLASDEEDNPLSTPTGLDCGSNKNKKKSKSLVGHKRRSIDPPTVDPYAIYMERFLNSTDLLSVNLASKFNEVQVPATMAHPPPPPPPPTLSAQVYDGISKLNIEPAKTRIYLITKIATSPYYTDIFLAMTDIDRANFVHEILEGNVP